MRILVAEDDPGLRDVIVLGLAERGYHVDAVDRGDDAIVRATGGRWKVASAPAGGARMRISWGRALA